MAFGITDEGFVRKRLEDILSDLEQEYQAEFGAIDIEADSVLGVIIGIQSKAFADLWEGLEAVYNSLYPASSFGLSLDNCADLVGINRLAATKSYGYIQPFGDVGIVLSAGRVVSVAIAGDRFETINSVTISPSTGTTKALVEVVTVLDSTVYAVTINGTVFDITSDGTATAEEIAAALVTDIGLGAEPVIATDNLDGTFYIDADDGVTDFTLTVDSNLDVPKASVNAEVQSEEYGPITGLTGTITVIETPVSGWDSVTNGADITVGRNDETDTELRQRRTASLQITGAGTVESIRSRLLQVDNVTGVFVEENDTNVTDGDGRPPHSFEAVVAGGDDQDIADLIWLVKPAGIESHGSTTVAVTDSQGNSHNMKFSRATEIFLWVKVTITTYSEETYPADGDDQVAAKVLEYGNTLDIGNDVLVQRFMGPIYEVEGIASVVVEIATSATAGGPPGAYQTTNLAIANTEVAVFDSARITIL